MRLFQGSHYDKYLQCHISTENTIFIATANSIEDIPETILNRFNAIIYFDEYTHKDKFVIAKQYVIPEVLKFIICHPQMSRLKIARLNILLQIIVKMRVYGI